MGNCPKDVFHGALGYGAGSGPHVGLSGRVLKGIITVSPDRLRTVIVSIDKYKWSIPDVSLQGFQVLVEMEWLDFGHKFADRCGHGENSDDLNERCPVFLQWLDCVHQLQRQFPCSFEFNEAFLVSLGL